MRWYRISATALAILGAVGCGGDGGGGPSNADPVAKFSIACTQLACAFTDASTDDGSIALRSWNFGEASSGSNNTSTDPNPNHSYAAAGAYHVTLTVTDNQGASSAVADSTVTVTGTPANANPAAQFDFSCTSLDCTFTDQSTDSDGTIASWDWDFGDGSPHSTVQNPSHSYTVTTLTSETVTLTVTDNSGGTATRTHQANVAPPAGLSCNGSACSLDLTTAAVVTVTLTSEDCNADGNTFIITAPVVDTLFTDGCHSPVPGTPAATFTLNNGAAFNAGTQITAAVVSGSGDLGFTPTIRVTGAFPDWTLEFDDGEAGVGEPDFNDLVLTVHAQ